MMETKEAPPPVPLNHPRHRDTTWKYRRLSGSLLLSQADIEMLNVLRPLCGRCHKPVEEFAWNHSPAGRAMQFHIECHGEKMSMSVGFDEIPTIMLGGVQGAVVFAEPKLIGYPMRGSDE
jgi:hypothetical protein